MVGLDRLVQEQFILNFHVFIHSNMLKMFELLVNCGLDLYKYPFCNWKQHDYKGCGLSGLFLV